MTDIELIHYAITANEASFSLSIAVFLAIFGYKFSRHSIERADSLCARLRGELSNELRQSLRPFFPSDEIPEVANVTLLDPNGRPLETASAITNASSLDSEAFQQVFRDFLDGESANFDRYWQASNLRTAIKGHWSTIRSITGVWPICSFVAICLFWGMSEQLIPLLPRSWLYALAILLLMPLILLIGKLPFLAHTVNLLEGLEG